MKENNNLAYLSRNYLGLYASPDDFYRDAPQHQKEIAEALLSSLRTAKTVMFGHREARGRWVFRDEKTSRFLHELSEGKYPSLNGMSLLEIMQELMLNQKSYFKVQPDTAFRDDIGSPWSDETPVVCQFIGSVRTVSLYLKIRVRDLGDGKWQNEVDLHNGADFSSRRR